MRTALIFPFWLLLTSTVIFAQQKNSPVLMMDPVTVTATRSDRLMVEIPQAINTIKRDQFTD
ncbi:MAG TPA: hypothetical protein PK531_11805, partial [Nitrosomonas sp.]|nr:hypothetical protein [Nitrosomonas sp.]